MHAPSNVRLPHIGQLGFGNCLFQYAAAKAFAKKTGAVLECAAWSGNSIFSSVDAGISAQPAGALFTDYHQTQCDVDTYSRAEVKEWFAFNARWHDLLLATPRRPIVAHVRRGDTDSDRWRTRYAAVPRNAYIKAAARLGFVETDIHWVSDYKICHSGCKVDLSFVPDFITMMRAEVLLRANSTFSWWAATLGTGTVLSPVVGDAVGWVDCAFVAGNWPKMTPNFDDLHLKA